MDMACADSFCIGLFSAHTQKMQSYPLVCFIFLVMALMSQAPSTFAASTGDCAVGTEYRENLTRVTKLFYCKIVISVRPDAMPSDQASPEQMFLASDPCVSATMNMVGVCGSFVSKVQGAAKSLVGAPDADIAAAAAQIPPPTTPYVNRP